MRYDLLAKDMRPETANEAWRAGQRAHEAELTDNPFPISLGDGGDNPDYWYWDAGWWYSARNWLAPAPVVDVSKCPTYRGRYR